MQKLKVPKKKKNFSVLKKIDYSKMDKKLYAEDSDEEHAAHNKSGFKDDKNTSITRKISPLK